MPYEIVFRTHRPGAPTPPPLRLEESDCPSIEAIQALALQHLERHGSPVAPGGLLPQLMVYKTDGAVYGKFLTSEPFRQLFAGSGRPHSLYIEVVPSTSSDTPSHLTGLLDNYQASNYIYENFQSFVEEIRLMQAYGRKENLVAHITARAQNKERSAKLSDAEMDAFIGLLVRREISSIMGNIWMQQATKENQQLFLERYFLQAKSAGGNFDLLPDLLRDITKIDLSDCSWIVDDDLSHLVRCATTLTELDLSATSFPPRLPHVTDRGLDILSRCPTLSKLCLRGNYHFTQTGLSHLSRLPLTSLDLSDCNQVTNTYLAAFPSYFPRLQSLYLARCPISGEGLHSLATLPLLEDLSLYGINFNSTPEALDALATFPRLEKLSLTSHTGDAAEIIKRIAFIPLLKKLHLRGPTMTGEGEVLTPLSRLSRLVELGIESFTFTDAGMAKLSSLVNLEELRLPCCHAITDSSLESIQRLSKLKKLSLTQCQQISGAAVERFREAKPSCEVRAFIRGRHV